MESKFKKGDLVKLKSGGEEMTVKANADDDIPHLMKRNVEMLSRKVICVWFEGGKLKEKEFHEDLLELSNK